MCFLQLYTNNTFQNDTDQGQDKSQYFYTSTLMYTLILFQFFYYTLIRMHISYPS